MPDALDYLSLEDDVLVAQCQVDCFRASGPGGQKRNKTSSAVRLRHGPTGLAVVAAEDRSQQVNRRRAIRRLRHAIALHVRAAVDPADYAASELVVRSLGLDRGVGFGRRDPRYFAVVAEVLDVLYGCGMRVRAASRCLGVSTAGLVRFIAADRALWKRVNELRKASGVRPLR